MIYLIQIKMNKKYIIAVTTVIIATIFFSCNDNKKVKIIEEKDQIKKIIEEKDSIRIIRKDSIISDSLTVDSIAR